MVLRPFEHQVLEQVREAGVARLLVLRPDVIPEIHGDDRTRVILVQEHVEAVGERLLGERDVERHGQTLSHRTMVNGIVAGRLKLAIDTCAAARSAVVMKACAAGESGSLIMSGTPVSPPSRIGW